MFRLLKKLRSHSLLSPDAAEITRTCKYCGRSFTLPVNVQSWPDVCLACRAKHHSSETVTRTCRGCGRSFTFLLPVRRWPKYCQACREKRRTGLRP